jgi:multidrug resistance protein, MATE family
MEGTPLALSRRGALKQVIALSTSVVVTELGLMLMGVVDTLVVGRIGPEAIGAVGLGNILFVTVAVFGMGLLLGLDPLVAQAFGAGRMDECYRWLAHGIVLALLATVPLLLIVRGLIMLLPWLGIEPSVLALAVPYMEVSAWAIPSLLLFAALRRFLQALGIVRPIAFVVLVGNVLNLLLAMGLVLGFGPIPALGTVGSAWATLLSRTDLMLVLAGIVVWHARRHAPRPMPGLLAFDMDRVRRLVALGIPAAFQMTLEVGVFATATALIARLDVVSLSAHQIVIQVTTLTFVVTIGIGAAGAVLVGQSLGEGNPDRARMMGWMALVAGAAFMGCAALGFLLFGQAIVGAFTADPTVIRLGGTLLLVAAAFQLFDGLQAVATGILRGAGDTRTPMLTNLAGHWFLGLPLGYGLAFGLGHGVIGMWVGLSVGLMVVGVVLVTTWRHRARRLMPAFGVIDGARHG